MVVELMGHTLRSCWHCHTLHSDVFYGARGCVARWAQLQAI